MMREVGVLALKTHLSAVLEEVERGGEEVAITRRGKVVARLVGPAQGKKSLAEVGAELERLRQDVVAKYGGASDEDIRDALSDHRE